ncbi:MAG: NTP transferase domain-containing protein [Anaerolineales bacterium]|jgi:molybdenum cofactor cytidylyltransferase
MIAAIVLAAGMSRRMGRPKLILPWGSKTIIEHVVATLRQAGIGEIVVVLGSNHAQVANCLQDDQVRLVHNPDFASTDMLESFQAGLRSLGAEFSAALVCLGDQPQIEVEVVKRLVNEYNATRAGIVIPSYNNHRGHPWIVDRQYWPEVLTLPQGATLRLFLERHREAIDYVLVNTQSILQDLDTPADYAASKPD